MTDPVDFLDVADAALAVAHLQHPRTGHADLDALTGGLRPGGFFLLSGPTGVGASMTGLTIARTAAAAGHSTLIVNCELSNADQYQRVIAAEARIPTHHLMANRATEEEWDRLGRKLHELADANLPIVMHDSWVTFDAIANHVHENAGKYRVLFIDGLNQLARAVAPEQRAAAHAELTSAVKRLARMTGITVVATVPTNRRAGYAAAGFLSAAWSSSYETDADVVIYLYREDMFDRESPRAGEVDLKVTVNRYGPPATITAAFQPHYARTVEMVRFAPPSATP